MPRWSRTLWKTYRMGMGQKRKVRRRPAIECLEERNLLAGSYLQTNLVSDGAVMASVTDPNLHNPWGMVAGPGGPFWVSDNGAGVSTLYNGAGQPFPVFSPLVVNIPTGSATPAGTTATPTGIVFNGNAGDFIVSQGTHSGHAIFIFATLDGTISGWNPGVNLHNAIRIVDNSAAGASYTGLALANNGSGNFLYAANFATGAIDVFNAQFQHTTLAGSFTDPHLPSGFAPYGIQSLAGSLYVTYAPQNFSPNGVVDLFDTNGHFIRRLITGGNLNMPWGLAISPHDFGQLSNALLVGNVGDGHINAYDPHSGAFRGQLETTNGQPFAEPGLWSLRFGNDGVAGSSDALFFTAGINGYADGLLGSLTVPQHAVASHHISKSIIPNLPPSPTLFVSTLAPTGPTAGDQNPYGIAFVPPHFATGGPLNPGDILVSNFNNASNAQGTGNLQGMGRTIVRITPNGQTSVFFQAPSDIAHVGLTTALGVLRRGFVLVGNVPTTDGTSSTVMVGSLMIIDRNGNLVENLTDSALLDGPWDLTINDLGDKAQVFVANVLIGTVTRIDLEIPAHGNPIVESETQIASGYGHRTDPMALVVGPTGLAYDAQHDILYVASTEDNEIFAISDARDRQGDGGTGRLVIEDTTHLHGPLGLFLAPNGDLITANGDAVNPDHAHSSEIVEFTPAGQFVGQISLNPLPDAPFGIALQFAGPDSQVRFAAVDDNTNTVHVWNIDLDGRSSTKSKIASSHTRQQDMTAVNAMLFASETRLPGTPHGETVESLIAARAGSSGAPDHAPASGATAEQHRLTLRSARALGKPLAKSAADIAFGDFNLFHN
jgi:uncharacterized protein (TIGR03118 family)